jgi:predicted ATPase
MSGSQSYLTAPAIEGRRDDLELIHGLVRSVDGGALVLVGDPGVGKTALLDAAADEANRVGSRVIRGAGAEFEVDVSFSTLNQALRPLERELSNLTDEQRSSVAVALGLSSGAPPDRAIISNAVLELLSASTADQPLLLVVDDLQWIDRASAAVLSYVTRRLAGIRVTFVGASRPSFVACAW